MSDAGITQAHFGGATRDTIDTEVVPVILVPGVMGSRIVFPDDEWNTNSAANMVDWGLSTRRRVLMASLDVTSPGTIPVDIPISYISPVGRLTPQRDLRNGRTLEIPILRTDPALLRPAAGRGGVAHNQRRARTVTEFWQRRGFGGIDWASYFPILNALVNRLNPGPGFFEPRPVYACGYDWRQSNTASARTLEQCIRRAFEEHPLAERVILITHSMGGLVARALLAAGNISQAQIAGVVHTVMPADGTPVAYRRFQTGAIEGTDEQQEATGAPIDGPGPFRGILGPDTVQYALTQSVLRGPTELLPHATYPDVFVTQDGRDNRSVGNLFADIYLHPRTQGGVLPTANETSDEFAGTVTVTVETRDIENLRQRMNEARRFSESVAGVVHPKTFLLVGTGHQTDVSLDLRTLLTTPDFTFLDRITRSDAGDGTVAQVSAEFRSASLPLPPPFGRQLFTADHQNCFAVEELRAAVLDCLQGLP